MADKIIVPNANEDELLLEEKELLKACMDKWKKDGESFDTRDRWRKQYIVELKYKRFARERDKPPVPAEVIPIKPSLPDLADYDKTPEEIVHSAFLYLGGSNAFNVWAYENQDVFYEKFYTKLMKNDSKDSTPANVSVNILNNEVTDESKPKGD